MLDELRNLNNTGGRDNLLNFLCDVLRDRKLSFHDAESLCSYMPGRSHLTVSELIKYCMAMGWVNVEDGKIIMNEDLITLIDDKNSLNKELIARTVNLMFTEHVFEPKLFSYDEGGSFYYFHNTYFPLTLFCIRNMLISQGFFVPIRDSQVTHFFIAEEYECLVAKYCKQRKRQMSLEQLKKKIEEDEIAGEMAELFVLEYEKKRLGEPKEALVKRISEIDVSAGYDIVSFDSSQSNKLDRFIEVKAVSRAGFLWSRNEYEVAKLKGENYHIYLVNLQRVGFEGYEPDIITNPALTIMQSDDWYVEAQSYFIRRV